MINDATDKLDLLAARCSAFKKLGERAVDRLPVVLFMMTAYPKNERDDLPPEQRKAIIEAIASITGVEP